MVCKGAITMRKEIKIGCLYFFIGGVIFLGLLLVPYSLKNLYMAFLIGMIIGILIGDKV